MGDGTVIGKGIGATAIGKGSDIGAGIGAEAIGDGTEIGKGSGGGAIGAGSGAEAIGAGKGATAIGTGSDASVIGEGSGAAVIGEGNGIGIRIGAGIGERSGAAVRGVGNFEAATLFGANGVPGTGASEGDTTGGAGAGPLNSPLHHDKINWIKNERNLIWHVHRSGDKSSVSTKDASQTSTQALDKPLSNHSLFSSFLSLFIHYLFSIVCIL